MNTTEFVSLTNEELMDTDGGVAGWIIVGGCIVLFCIGAYNGYREAAG